MVAQAHAEAKASDSKRKGDNIRPTQLELSDEIR